MSEDQLSPKALFAGYATQMDTLLLENQKAYDRAILTLSSASIAALLAFTQSKAVFNFTFGFFGAIVLNAASVIGTLLSFQLAQILVGQKKENAYTYYILGKHEVFATKLYLEKVLSLLHILNGLLFAAATVLAVIFISYSINKEGVMSKKHIAYNNDGMTGASMIKVVEVNTEGAKGLTGPQMVALPPQPVVSPPAEAPATAKPSTGDGNAK